MRGRCNGSRPVFAELDGAVEIEGAVAALKELSRRRSCLKKWQECRAMNPRLDVEGARENLSDFLEAKMDSLDCFEPT